MELRRDVNKWDSTEGGLLSKGHLSKVGTILLPVKSIYLFETFFLPCVQDSMAFFDHTRFVMLFVMVFLWPLNFELYVNSEPGILST